MNSTTLAGISICITGTLTHSRKWYVNLIKNAGGRFVREISGKVDYVLCGYDFGKKADKAEQLGVSFINESEFLSMAGVSSVF